VIFHSFKPSYIQESLWVQ